MSLRTRRAQNGRSTWHSGKKGAFRLISEAINPRDVSPACLRLAAVTLPRPAEAVVVIVRQQGLGRSGGGRHRWARPRLALRGRMMRNLRSRPQRGAELLRLRGGSCACGAGCSHTHTGAGRQIKPGVTVCSCMRKGATTGLRFSSKRSAHLQRSNGSSNPRCVLSHGCHQCQTTTRGYVASASLPTRAWA